MAFDINRFRANLQKEPASQSKFEVTLLAVPDALSSRVQRNMSFRCEDAEFPGRVISTTDFKDYGPVRKIAYGSMYNDVSLQFIVTDDMIEKKFFEDWHGLIVDDKLSSDVGYYSNYIGQIRIDQYSKDGNVVHSVTLDEAYPVTMAAMPVSWSAKDQYHKLTVDIAYRTYRSE